MAKRDEAIPDSVRLHMLDMEKYPLLRPEEEVELGRRARAGDEAAEQRLFNCNLRFAFSVAKRYQGRGLGLDELLSASHEGLLKAVRKFDPEMGTRLITYAAWWIRQQIRREIVTQAGTVKASQTQMDHNTKIWRLMQEAERRGERLSVEDLMQAADCSRRCVIEAIGYCVTTLSLDAPADPSDPSSATLAQMIGDEDSFLAVQETVERRMALDRVLRERLSPRERMILELHYGLTVPVPLPFNDIRPFVKLSRERVRQVHHEAIEKLRDAPEAPHLKELLFGEAG